ncbi:MAG: SycD/LcrH family type III secretion system chaperone [Chlamydiales bacterium]|nr:SycD/LcrH family type III secretion system chaperone [Chlamydiales bacterium]
MFERIVERVAKSGQFPEDFDAFLAGFVEKKLLQSETMQFALEISNREMEEMYAEAYAFYEEAHYKRASNIFRFLVMLDPLTSRYWLGLAACLQLLEKYEKALKCYAVVTLIDRHNPEPHYQAHACYTALGDEKEAALALEIAEEVKVCH